jgi:hypothetical protein
MNFIDRILFFHEGIGKRIALLSDITDLRTVIVTVEERTAVQHRTNQYDRYFICIPVYDYAEQRVKLLAGPAHHPIISKVMKFYQAITGLAKSHDLFIRVQYKEWTFESQTNLDVHMHLAAKIPGMPCLFEAPSYEEMKQAIIHWRESLGETVLQ